MQNPVKTVSLSTQASHRQRGTSLVELSVAIGILSVITLGSTALIHSMLQANAKAQYDNTIANEVMELRLMLADETTCTANLQKRAIASDAYSDEFKLSGYDSGSGTLSSSPLINSQILKGVKIRQQSDTIAKLYARFESNTDVAGPKEVFRDLSLSIEKGEDNTIVRCSSTPISRSPATDGGGDNSPLTKKQVNCLSQSGGLVGGVFPNRQKGCLRTANPACHMGGSNCTVANLDVLAGPAGTVCVWSCEMDRTDPPKIVIRNINSEDPDWDDED